MRLTSHPRVLASLVLAAGAAASIATSQIQWELNETAPIDPVVLDEANPSIGFRVHAEYTGALTEPQGHLSVGVVVEREPLAAAGGSLRVTIVDENGQTVAETPFTFDPTITTSQGPWTSAAVWDGCTDGCARDFEVWIDRTDPTDAAWPELRISGSIDAYLAEYGGASEPPAGTTLTLRVEPIELVP